MLGEMRKEEESIESIQARLTGPTQDTRGLRMYGGSQPLPIYLRVLGGSREKQGMEALYKKQCLSADVK